MCFVHEFEDDEGFKYIYADDFLVDPLSDDGMRDLRLLETNQR